MKRFFYLFTKSWHIILLFAVSFSVRFHVFQKMYPIVQTDSVTYLFLSDLGTVRTPGYPFFIELILSINDLFSLTNEHLTLLAFGQLFILGVLNSYLIYRITNLLIHNRVFASIMGIVYNFNYFVVSFEFQIMTETLSITLLLALIFFYIKLFEAKKSLGILAGFLSVSLLLTRATYLLLGFFLPIITLIVFYSQSKKKNFLKKIGLPLILFLIINMIGISGWSLRNKLKFDYFGVSSLLPYQLRYYTNSLFEKYKSTGDEELDKIATIYTEELRKVENPSDAVYNFHERIYKELHLSDQEISKAFLKINIKLIMNYPGLYLKQIPSSILSYYKQYSLNWTFNLSKRFINKDSIFPRIFMMFLFFYQKLFLNYFYSMILVIVAPAVLLLMVRKKKKVFHGWLLLEAVIIYNFLASVLSTNAGINNLRYRVPVEPLILLIFYSLFFYLGKWVFDFLYQRKKSLLRLKN